MNRLLLFKLFILMSWATLKVTLARTTKSFSLFSVVTFKNEECTTVMDSGMNGLCQSVNDCSENSGTASGNCASGFGVCCFYKVDSCDTAQTITNNVTYIQSPSYPTAVTTAETCTYTVTGASNICQLRLDFDNLVLDQPSAAAPIGDCSTVDRLAVDLTNVSDPPTLCGTISGQHIYADTSRATGTAATITITTVGTAASRTWKIKVRMLECASHSLAPSGCLQYFTGTGAKFESFNRGVTTPIMPTSLNYNICMRQEKGYCGMQVSESNPGGTPDSFLITESIGAGTAITTSLTGTNCDQGYVMVAGDRICGAFFTDQSAAANAAAVIDSQPPFEVKVLTVSTNLMVTGQQFELTYRLLPC